MATLTGRRSPISSPSCPEPAATPQDIAMRTRPRESRQCECRGLCIVQRTADGRDLVEATTAASLVPGGAAVERVGERPRRLADDLAQALDGQVQLRFERRIVDGRPRVVPVAMAADFMARHVRS